MNFPATAGQNSVALSVDDTQVQDALRVIDTVLTSQGFHQGTNAPAQNEQVLVVGYTHLTPKTTGFHLSVELQPSRNHSGEQVCLGADLLR